MKKFVLRVIAYLAVFAAGSAVISIVVLEVLGNLISRNVLDGLMMGTIVIVAGGIGGKLGNEFKALRNSAKRLRSE